MNKRLVTISIQHLNIKMKIKEIIVENKNYDNQTPALQN